MAMLIGNNIALVVYAFFMGSLLMNQIDSLSFFWLIEFAHSDSLVYPNCFNDSRVSAESFFQIYANGLIKFFALPAYVFYLLFYFISSFLISFDFVLKNFLERMGIRYSFI
jgi:uncharacterized membrane protein (DUF106 family)